MRADPIKPPEARSILENRVPVCFMAHTVKTKGNDEMFLFLQGSKRMGMQAAVAKLDVELLFLFCVRSDL